MSKKPSVVENEVNEVHEILESCAYGVPLIRLSWLRRYSWENFNRSLDLDDDTIKRCIDEMVRKRMVLFYDDPVSEEKYVMSARAVEDRRKRLKDNVEKLLQEHGGTIQLSSFEKLFIKRFKVTWDSHFFCVRDVVDICSVLNLVVKEAHPGEKVIMSKKPSVTENEVNEVHEILESCAYGVPLIRLSWLRRYSWENFNRSLDLDDDTIKRCIDEMVRKRMVLFYDDPVSEEKYVMSARAVEDRRKRLKDNVEKLLQEHGGTIQLSSFEKLFIKRFKVTWDSHFFCVRDVVDICSVLNLVVEEAHPGEKVIMAVKPKRYDLRKRKKRGLPE